MKKIVFSGFVAFCLMLISCQSEKTKVCKIVDDFLKYNDTLSLSEEYKEAYKSCEKIAYLDDYKLIANKYRDSIYRVETAEQVMNNAQREIIIAGYSFGNSVPEIMQNLGKAAAKDVTIRIIFNKFENMKDTVKEYYLNLQKQWTNVRLYNYLGTNTSDLHVKAIAVDHTKAMIGSANFSYTAFETNYEISAVITGDSAYIIRNLLMRLLGVCEPVQ